MAPPLVACNATATNNLDVGRYKAVTRRRLLCVRWRGSPPVRESASVRRAGTEA